MRWTWMLGLMAVMACGGDKEDDEKAGGDDPAAHLSGNESLAALGDEDACALIDGIQYRLYEDPETYCYGQAKLANIGGAFDQATCEDFVDTCEQLISTFGSLPVSACDFGPQLSVSDSCPDNVTVDDFFDCTVGQQLEVFAYYAQGGCDTAMDPTQAPEIDAECTEIQACIPTFSTTEY